MNAPSTARRVMDVALGLKALASAKEPVHSAWTLDSSLATINMQSKIKSTVLVKTVTLTYKSLPVKLYKIL